MNLAARFECLPLSNEIFANLTRAIAKKGTPLQFSVRWLAQRLIKLAKEERKSGVLSA